MTTAPGFTFAWQSARASTAATAATETPVVLAGSIEQSRNLTG